MHQCALGSAPPSKEAHKSSGDDDGCFSQVLAGQMRRMEHPPYFRVRLSKFFLMSGLPTESPATCAPRPCRLSPFAVIVLIPCTMITNTLSLIHLTRGAQYIAAIKGRRCLISGPTGGGYRARPNGIVLESLRRKSSLTPQRPP